MTPRRSSLPIAIAFVLFLSAPASADAAADAPKRLRREGGPSAGQTAVEYYDANCAACHTIGTGNGNGGPDLKDVTRRREREWLIRFLLRPEEFSDDPVVRQMIKDAGGLEMPAIDGLTREMAAALLDFIDRRSAEPGSQAAAAPDTPFTPEDIARGRDLFTGRAALAAHGPACVQCHDAATLAGPGGGGMGPDLTLAHARLGGTRGLNGWLRATPTPMMRAVYHSASLTPDESRALTAFLEDAARRGGTARTARLLPFAGGALALALAILAGIGLTGARRFRGVRAALVAAHRHGAGTGGSR